MENSPLHVRRLQPARSELITRRLSSHVARADAQYSPGWKARRIAPTKMTTPQTMHAVAIDARRRIYRIHTPQLPGAAAKSAKHLGRQNIG
jgi:hypothetical protein